MGLSLELIEGHGPVYCPEDGDGLPGLLILHGSEGPMAGWSHRFAAILAAHGVLAMPWSYGEGDFWAAGPIREVDISPALDAMDALSEHPRCRNAGLFGWSRGGELALLLASLRPDRVPFAAAHAASDRVNGAFDPEEFTNGGGAGHEAARAWVMEGEAARLAPGARIEIEHYVGPVFLSVGTADEVWDHRMTLRLAEKLEAAGNPPDVWVAEGQGHALDMSVEPELWARLLGFIEKVA